MSEKLLGCPFCGAKPIVFPVNIFDEEMGENEASVMCGNDECAISPTVSPMAISLAIRAWNRRADPPELIATRARLAEAEADAARLAFDDRADMTTERRRAVEGTRQLQILWHALGVTPDKRRPYRKHFVTGAGSDDHPDCVALVKLRLMQQHPASSLTGGNDLFTVTDAGRRFALYSLPDPPKLTRSQKRYRRFLSQDSGLSFHEWLRAYG